MEVILKEDFEKLGKAGETIRVADGYARNYLIPRGVALEATKPNWSIYQEQKKQKVMQENRLKRTAQNLARELGKISLTAAVSVGEEDRVFGAVTAQTITELLKAKDYDIDRRKIVLDEPIKALGVYSIEIKLHPEVETKVKLWVVKEH
ncbi:MAG: 50S ribosomal protein L9 [Candidatus Latescibacteria bacterium]|nr:50S ribosomal protein L9 [Candidatus Latescibacterota bacterium]